MVENKFFYMLGVFLMTTHFVFSQATNYAYDSTPIKVGAERTENYVADLANKKVGLVVNHTAVLDAFNKQVHLVDTLLKLKVDVIKIFAPEHGFRGAADAGEKVEDSKDSKTQIPVISLYGKNKKPSPESLKDIDILIFDIQDVGARFYTYISTLHYVMEACAENNIPLVILDRPNPNGFYVDGPVLDTAFKSFVGMHPVPVVHGMTIGEYAQMINGEKWLNKGITCRLKVITCENYFHARLYQLPVDPSPNLKTMTAIYLYPSLCFFEGTKVSVGRGTDTPFEIIGYPNYLSKKFQFTPKSISGAKNPPYLNTICYGMDLHNFGKNYFFEKKTLELSWLIGLYQKDTIKNDFFNDFFDKLAGTNQLRLQIISGKSEKEIRLLWQQKLEEYIVMRKNYLLYKDF